MPEYDIGFGPLRGPADGLSRDAEPDTDRTLDVPNLQLSVSYVKDGANGAQTAIVTATWDAPTRGEDLGGTAKNLVTGYWVSDRQGTAAVPDLSWSAERKVTERKVVFRKLNLKTLMDFRVRAQTGEGTYGPFAFKSANTAQDTEAPERPSKAVLEPALRGVIIKWDGKTFSGLVQPNDFARCEAEVSIDGGPWQNICQFDRNGGSFYFNTPNTSSRIYKARLRSFDFTGNVSAYTETDPKASFDFTAAASAASGDNSVKNASFEDFRDPVTATPKSWTLWGGSFTQEQDPQQSFHGGFSQRVGNAASAGGYEQVMPVIPETQYTMSMYVRPDGAGRGSMNDAFLLSATEDTGAQHTLGGYSALPSNQWTRINKVFTTGSSTRTVKIRIHVVGGGFMHVDAVQLEAGTLTPFAPRAGEIGRQTFSMADIRDLLITTDLLADGAVSNAKMRDAAISAAKTDLASIDPNSGSLRINSVVTNNLVAGSVTAIKILSDEILTRHIAADQVTGAKILAGSITASKLSIGRLGDNLVLNGGFESDFDGWVGDGPGGRSVEPSSSSHGTSGTKHARLFSGGATTRILQEVGASAIAGKFYYLSAFLSSDGPSCVAGVFWYRQDNSVIGFSQALNVQPPRPGRVFDSQVKAPDGTAKAIVMISATGSALGELAVDEVVLREVIGTTQIMDGAVTTDKVIATGISADKIAAGTISASIRIFSPTIEAGTINSGAINGGSITGSLITTGAGGQNRVQMFDGGIKDVISFVTVNTPQGEAITGDLRGGLLPQGYLQSGGQPTYGLFVNSTVQLGNTQSVIHQVGKRAARPGADQSVRVRADSVNAVFSNGSARITWSPPMSQPPTYVVVTMGDTTDGRPTIHRVSGLAADGFDLTVFVQSASTKEIARPGGTPTMLVHYVAEIVV